MVLGPRTKNRKSPTVHLDYLIHIQEVRPWPPSQSLRNLRSVLIQWEHGERNSGSTNPVVPLLGAGVGDGKIEFNESFRLPVTLSREMSIKGGDSDIFQKNCLEFNLYEPRRDKTVRGQLLGTAIIDLADYGIVKENLTISVPINSKRSYGKTAQPVLLLKLQSIEKGRTGFSSRDNQSKQAFTGRNGGESVSALMDEEYAEEAEFASITDDDDVSSHSSLVVSSSAFETNGGLSPHSEEAMKDSAGEAYNHHLTSKPGFGKIETRTVNELDESLKVSSSADLSPDMRSLAHGHAALSNFPETSLTSMPKQIVAHGVQSSISSINYEGSEEEINNNMISKDYDNLVQDTNCGNEICTNVLQGSEGNKLNGSLARVASLDHQVDEKLSFEISTASEVNQECIDKVRTPGIEAMHYVSGANCGPVKDTDRQEDQENGQGAQILLERQHSMEDQPWNRFSQDHTRKQVSSGSDALSSNGENLGLRSNILNNDRLKHVKSVRSPLESAKSNGSVRSVKLGDAQNGPQGFAGNEKDTKAYAKETRNITSDGRIQQLEHRIKMLEGELREAAAIEVGLYSVVAEHGSSISKVHAPARRLSRLYLHVGKESSLSRRASAARSAVSGLVLVAKACGNDVPRLTFWLSNSVVLRAIISRAFAEQQLPLSSRPGSGKANRNKLSPLKWKESSSSKETKGALCGSVDWEDPHAFISALEKIEAWIFSRIIESVWWQALTPHMQSAAAKAINRGMAFSASKTYRRTSSSVDQDQVNFSLDLWKKAFKDARERLCPVRAGGHECGCLPVLARLIMEQCVARLDVAMFNAILRESDDEIPTDPVSDPISDAKVLPIPAGKASFGAGAQLKNAIGNWSRWLTDLFGIDDDDDDDDSLEDKNDHNNNDDKKGNEHDASKSFHLLNALSDLMMLPKDMLFSSSNRKEVCPTIGAPLIKRVLSNFVPDEFCPDPIPDGLLEALDSEDSLEAWEDCVANFPCSAAPIMYLPPPAVSFAGIIGEIGSQSRLRRSGSSVLKKSYTSDDELGELDSPLTTIIEGFQTSPSAKRPSWMSKEYGSGNTVRYQLLREVWMNSE